MTENEALQDTRIYVRERYGKIAETQATERASCCEPASSGCCGPDDGIQEATSDVVKLYEVDVSELPEDVTNLSLGCGDPVTLASLVPGQVVLDLGSGGGIDCFLAAKQVGTTGKVIGVDMTPAMIDRARANQKKIGVENVEFRLGEIEHLPAADNSVDVIISNCVINLSPDKPQVFREAFRVLRPGGKIAVSDIVTDGPLPEIVKSSLSAWARCVAGALDIKDYVGAIEEAGFVDVEVKPVKLDDAVSMEAIDETGAEIQLDNDSRKKLAETVFSARVTGYKL